MRNPLNDIMFAYRYWFESDDEFDDDSHVEIWYFSNDLTAKHFGITNPECCRIERLGHVNDSWNINNPKVIWTKHII